MIVTFRYARILCVLNVFDGTILRWFDAPSDNCTLYPILGSLHCSYEHAIGTQTGKSYYLCDKGIYIDRNNLSESFKYGRLCAKYRTKNNQLTLLDWQS